MSKIDIVQIKKKHYVFIDFFDTTVHRNKTPEQIKEEWSKKLASLIEFTTTPRNIFMCRKDAERELEKTYGFKYSYEQLMAEVWNRLFDVKGININKATFVQKSLYLEAAIESSYLYIDEYILKLLKSAQGKKVYIVSDYHMGKSILQRYMNTLNVSEFIDGYFVSCDCNASKYSGDLYDVVIQTLKCNRSDCIMIGDNEFSDVKMSAEKGIASIYRPYITNAFSCSKNYYNDKLKILLEKRNFSGYCFSLALFTEQLYISLKKEKIQDVFFLSREGEFLKRLFDKYCEIYKETNIKTHYLYISRQSTFVASLNENIEEEKFNTLFRQFNNISVETFLKNLNFSQDEIDEIGKKIINMKIRVDNFSESEEFKQLKKLSCFCDVYRKHVSLQKKLFRQYLRQEGYKNGVLCLVDVGWKGTIQDNISYAYNLDNTILGYYLGYGEVCKGERNPQSQKTGLLFSVVPYKTVKDSYWAIDAGMFEKILYASHPSTSGYQLNKNVVTPIFKKFEEENGVYQKIKPIQMDIFERCTQIFNLFADTSFTLLDFENVLLNLHLKSILTFNYEKINFRKSVEEKHFENFGLFETVDVGKTSDNFSIRKNTKYFIRRIKKIFDPLYFTFNAYHFTKVRSKLFWRIYSGIVYKQAINVLKSNKI